MEAPKDEAARTVARHYAKDKAAATYEAAANDQDACFKRLSEAEAKLTDPDETLLTWGFHHYFHGKLTRADLDKISDPRPITVWHRSCHEFIVNTAALETFGVTGAFRSLQSLPFLLHP